MHCGPARTTEVAHTETLLGLNFGMLTSRWAPHKERGGQGPGGGGKEGDGEGERRVSRSGSGEGREGGGDTKGGEEGGDRGRSDRQRGRSGKHCASNSRIRTPRAAFRYCWCLEHE
jgi:hypothetical protein